MFVWCWVAVCWFLLRLCLCSACTARPHTTRGCCRRKILWQLPTQRCPHKGCGDCRSFLQYPCCNAALLQAIQARHVGLLLHSKQPTTATSFDAMLLLQLTHLLFRSCTTALVIVGSSMPAVLHSRSRVAIAAASSAGSRVASPAVWVLHHCVYCRNPSIVNMPVHQCCCVAALLHA
jgi:hypothetical protein